MNARLRLVAAVMGFLLSVGLARGGESVTVQGKIEKVDVDERKLVISVPDSYDKLELEVTRKTKIRRDEKDVGIDAVKAGDQAKIKYDSDLLVASTIELGIAGPTEALNLEELNSENGEGGLWLTPDGLEIFWNTLEGDPKIASSFVVHTARRKSAEAFFTEKRRLFSGHSPVLSSDGLTMFFRKLESETIHLATRMNRDEEFGRPRPQPSLSFSGLDPAPRWLSADGLTLYLDMQVKEDNGRYHTWEVNRESVKSNWQKPKLVKAEFKGKPKDFRFVQVSSTADNLHLYCAAEFTSDAGQRIMRLGILSRPEQSGPYREWREIPLTAPNGQSATCLKPQFIPATNELFLTSNAFFADPQSAEKRRFDLWVIKDFVPPK
jgi:hypothetical protein